MVTNARTMAAVDRGESDARGRCESLGDMVRASTPPTLPRPGTSCPVIIGIAGASGSGKSSITQLIQKKLPRSSVATINFDFYYISLAPGKSAAEHNWDHPNALDTPLLAAHLRELRRGGTVNVPQYDFALHRRTDETLRVGPVDVVIVDGIFTLAVPEIRELCDLKLYCFDDLDVCLSRRIIRDISERGRTVESVLDQYIKFVKPAYHSFIQPSMIHAHLIIPNAKENLIAQDVLARDVLAQIECRRGEA